MSKLSLERDIYPVFSSGDPDKIVEALEKVRVSVEVSTLDADSIFRSFNWSWPLLTAKARSGSSQGIAIIEGFASLLTSLLTGCSPVILGSISGCKNVIRIVMRDLGSIDPKVSRKYLDAVFDRILKAKDVRSIRGFFLEKSAIEHMILLPEASRLVESALVHRKLFTVDYIVDFLVKFVKARNASAECSLFVVRVLEAHQSAAMYDMFMGKLGFLSLSNASLVQKLSVIHFFSVLVKSKCPGNSIFPAFTKSEITQHIIGGSSNRLVILLTLRLYANVLERLNIGSPLLHQMVEINSLLPLLKSVGENSPQNTLLLMELSRVILAYKRVFPGSFLECKFNWSKLVSEDNPPCLILRLVFLIYCDSVPVTNHLVNILDKLVSLDSPFSRNLINTFFIKHYQLVGEPEIFLKQFWKNPDRQTLLKHALTVLVDRPSTIKQAPHNVLLSILNQTGNEEFAKKVEGKTNKRKRQTDSCEALEKEESTQVSAELPNEPAAKLPRIARKNRFLFPPCPFANIDPFDPVMAAWATICLANEWEQQDPVQVDVVELVGKKINTLFASIMSLSHPDSIVWQSAFEVLAIALRAFAMCIQIPGRFPFREAPQVAMVLTWLRNSIVSDEGPILRISSVFAVEVLKIIFSPQHALYPHVYKLVLSRAALRVDWAHFFFGTDAALVGETRRWIQFVIQQGGTDEPGCLQAVMESSIHLNGTREDFDSALGIVKHALIDNPTWVRKFGVIHWLSTVSSSKFLRED